MRSRAGESAGSTPCLYGIRLKLRCPVRCPPRKHQISRACVHVEIEHIPKSRMTESPACSSFIASIGPAGTDFHPNLAESSLMTSTKPSGCCSVTCNLGMHELAIAAQRSLTGGRPWETFIVPCVVLKRLLLRDKETEGKEGTTFQRVKRS